MLTAVLRREREMLEGSGKCFIEFILLHSKNFKIFLKLPEALVIRF